MDHALLAAALVLAVSSARAAIVRPGLALPGFAEGVRAAAPRAADEFPSTAGLFGGGEDPLTSLDKGDEDLRDAMASPQSLAALQAGLRAPGVDARVEAVRAAARPRAVAGVPALSAALLRLDEPAQVRSAAALALGRIGDRVAIPALAEALRDPLPSVRYAAALALGRLPADGVATRLEHVLRTDVDWRARYAAAIALGLSRKAFAAGSLSSTLSDDPAWQVRQQAARSLQDLGNPRAAPGLAAALKDPEPSVRAAAGDALADLGGAAGRQAIVAALKTESEPSVRAMLSFSLRRTQTRP